MQHNGKGRYLLDPLEKAEIFGQVFEIPSDPNGPANLEAFEKLCRIIENHVSHEVGYNQRMRGCATCAERWDDLTKSERIVISSGSTYT